MVRNLRPVVLFYFPSRRYCNRLLEIVWFLYKALPKEKSHEFVGSQTDSTASDEDNASLVFL